MEKMESYTEPSLNHNFTGIYSSGSTTTDNGIIPFKSSFKIDPKYSVKDQETTEYIILIVMCIVSVVINIRVFCIVMYSRRKRHRGVSILLAHLTVLTIASNLHEALFFADKADLIILRAPYICGFLSFVRKVLHGAVPLNIYAIIYERVNTIRITNQQEKCLVMRTILLIWTLAIGGSIPSLVSYGFERDPNGLGFGVCKKIRGEVFRSTYQMFRVLLYNGATSVGVGWALYTIRSKMKYLNFLQPIPSEKTRRMVNRVRFVYIYATLFISVWLLLALFVFFCKLINPDLPFGNGVWLAKIFSFLYYTYCTLNPLIYLSLNESMSIGYILGYYSTKSILLRLLGPSPVSDNHTRNEEAVENNERRDLELTDMSRYPTVAISEENNTLTTNEQPNTIVIEVKADVHSLVGVFV